MTAKQSIMTILILCFFEHDINIIFDTYRGLLSRNVFAERFKADFRPPCADRTVLTNSSNRIIRNTRGSIKNKSTRRRREYTRNAYMYYDHDVCIYREVLRTTTRCQ